MGLDQYAYVAARAGQYDDYFVSPYGKTLSAKKVVEPREIAYWRKHPNLHGWMERRWLAKKNIPADKADQFIYQQEPPTFNGIELELNWQDLDDLEQAVTKRRLPATRGFFFGDNSDQLYYQKDLEFIKKARAELFLGLKVFYNSSW